ncbi:MAG: ComEC/Rec2 family competence protein [Pseudobdellovibrio sp.]
MIIVYLLIIMLTTAASVRFSVYSLLKIVSLFFHQNCLSGLPHTSTATNELQAIVCGQNFSSAQTSQLYISTGLIHLFVVSGAHLILLERLLNATSITLLSKKLPLLLILISLIVYTLACEMNPPITRSLISIFISLLLNKNYLRWPANYKLFLVGIITLCINPDWASSVSLQLSWIAGLVVSIANLYFSKNDFLLKQSLYYIFLWPLLIFLSVPSYLVILVNLIFAPLLEFVLFPMGLLVWIFPFLLPVFEKLIQLLNITLTFLEFKMIFQTDLQSSIMIPFGWLFILTLHFSLHLTEINHRKRTYV